jgi:hypothetical protein
LLQANLLVQRKKHVALKDLLGRKDHKEFTALPDLRVNKDHVDLADQKVIVVNVENQVNVVHVDQ